MMEEYLIALEDAHDNMLNALNIRGNNSGIMVEKDKHALEYQAANAAFDKASCALRDKISNHKEQRGGNK